MTSLPCLPDTGHPAHSSDYCLREGVKVWRRSEINLVRVGADLTQFVSWFCNRFWTVGVKGGEGKVFFGLTVISSSPRRLQDRSQRGQRSPGNRLVRETLLRGGAEETQRGVQRGFSAAGAGRERSRSSELEQKINDVLKPRLEDSPSQTPKAPTPSTSAVSGTDKQKDTWSSSFRKCLYDRFGVYIEDFRFQQEEQTVETDEPLSAKRLTENMRRLKRGLKPLSNFKRNLTALSSWYSVYTSAIAFIVYMYAAWHGWAVPMFLFLAIVRLSLNYLIARGWRIQWSIVPEVSEPVEPPKEDLTVSEKFTLVLDVAQKAQNLFGRMPELTQKLYVGLWLAFISSCLLPFKLLGFFIGVYAGIKFFVIDFLFKSCPKLRQRFDTPFIIWTHLPTDLQLKERGGSTLTRRVTLSSGRGSVGPAAPLGASRDEDGGRYSSTKRGAFHEVFNLQESERPLTVCESGWRCCLINRDRKSPTDYIRNGYLYVTENHLCFESSSSRSGSSKRNKYKVLSVLPGSGSGISIATPSTTKPMVFGAMIHRDEAFDAIFNQHTKIVSAATAIEPET
ncbi:GRAM domain containing protein 4 [Dissostichus eleginoides]|uniref:GRAM domain containing protein 4 n=1 Tax=Dissostichus eleginoides TaxID=100907 RepID=A0AAD9BQQ8_DISEL|nr:GRAM domain containing protein 4 [Dissostichus eleginoides]